MANGFTRRRILRSLSAGTALVASTRLGAFAAISNEDFSKPATLRLGQVPLVSSGPVFLAEARKYFEQVNLKVESRFFADGALAIPSLVAGEIDLTATTCNAGLFNAISKGAPYKLFADRGQEKPGSGTLSIVVSTALHKAGLTGLDKFAMLKGKRLAIQAPGSIDQYILGKALQATGLDPRKDVEWTSGAKYPDMVKMMGVGQIDAAQIPVPLSYIAEKQQAGKLVAWGSDVEPNAQLACFAIRDTLLNENFSAAVRFVMVHMYAAREFNQAASKADVTVVKILSAATKLPPGVIQSSAPHWAWMAEDGMPNVASVMTQARYWHSYFTLVPQAVSEAQVFDLSAVKEAAARLMKSNPFK